MSPHGCLEERATNVPGGARVHLSLLGGFELSCDGRPVTLPRGPQRLIAFVALQSRPIMRLYAAGSVWPESSERRSSANLRSALWRIRRPGHAIVEADETFIGMSSLVAVDVQEMKTLSRRILSSQAPDGNSGALDSSLLASDLLPDWYDDWALLERERLRQLRLHALEALAREHAAAGRYALAIDTALAVVQAEPLRESAQLVLIQIHIEEHNVIEAVRAYEHYEKLLGTELGIAPSARLRALVTRR